MGMSRSATSVIMFIMRLFGMKLEDAFEFVKTQREATDPNDGFMEQLRLFEDKAFKFDSECDPNNASATHMKFSKFTEELHDMKAELASPGTPKVSGLDLKDPEAFKMSVKPVTAVYEEVAVKTFNFSVGPSAFPNDVLKTA